MMLLYFGAFLFFSHFIEKATGSDPPLELFPTPRKYSFNETFFLALICKNDDDKVLKIVWTRDNKPITKENFPDLVGLWKIRPSSSQDSTSSLNFRTTWKDDKSVIKCQYMGSNSKLVVSNTFVLNVTYIPRVRILGKKSVDVGQIVNLTCEFDSNPRHLKIRWLKDNDVLQHVTTGKLRKDKAEEKDAGVYKCEVTNSQGTGETSVNVDVLRLWDTWAAWSPCSKNCTRTRSRKCLASPDKCIGDSTVTIRCTECESAAFPAANSYLLPLILGCVASFIIGVIGFLVWRRRSKKTREFQNYLINCEDGSENTDNSDKKAHEDASDSSFADKLKGQTTDGDGKLGGICGVCGNYDKNRKPRKNSNERIKCGICGELDPPEIAGQIKTNGAICGVCGKFDENRKPRLHKNERIKCGVCGEFDPPEWAGHGEGIGEICGVCGEFDKNRKPRKHKNERIKCGVCGEWDPPGCAGHGEGYGAICGVCGEFDKNRKPRTDENERIKCGICGQYDDAGLYGQGAICGVCGAFDRNRKPRTDTNERIQCGVCGQFDDGGFSGEGAICGVCGEFDKHRKPRTDANERIKCGICGQYDDGGLSGEGAICGVCGAFDENRKLRIDKNELIKCGICGQFDDGGLSGKGECKGRKCGLCGEFDAKRSRKRSKHVLCSICGEYDDEKKSKKNKKARKSGGELEDGTTNQGDDMLAIQRFSASFRSRTQLQGGQNTGDDNVEGLGMEDDGGIARGMVRTSSSRSGRNAIYYRKTSVVTLTKSKTQQSKNP